MRSALVWIAKNRRRLLLGTAGAGSLLCVSALGYAGSCGFRGCPSLAEIRAYRPDHRTVPLAAIPENVRNAFIAVEDRRFREHDGVDWRSFGRAIVRNTASLEVREGASTITMQLARSVFIRGDECDGRSFRRKLIEVRLARRIERALTKDQILQLYLNSIYLGDGAYGVEAASRHHLGKRVGQLSASESALLAALPRAPARYDPADHPDRARARRNLVLGLMAEEGYLTVSQATAASGQQLRAAGQRRRSAATPASGRGVVRASAAARGTC